MSANRWPTDRRLDFDLVKRQVALRGRLLAIAQISNLSELANQGDEFDSIATAYEALSHELYLLDHEPLFGLMHKAILIASLLCRWLGAVYQASNEASTFISSARLRSADLASLCESYKDAASGTTAVPMSKWANTVLTINDPLETKSCMQELASIQLQPIYSPPHDRYPGIREIRAKREAGIIVEDENAQRSSLVKTCFRIDGQEIATGQAIRSGIQYDFSLEASISSWPPAAEVLRVDYVSTMGPADWSITTLNLRKPPSGETVSGSGHLIIRSSQSILSQPAHILVRARFFAGALGESQETTIIGHHELRFLALSEDSHPVLTKYKLVDVQVMKILSEVKSELKDLPVDQFEDFQTCLVMLSKYLAAVMQSGVFKAKALNGKIDEKRDFQQHLLQFARMFLGPEVREGESQTAGLLDLRYREITIELKVEYDNSDRSILRTKYIGQPTQYSAAASQLSIVCILDMTEKELPPANVANNISLETPAVHGFASNTSPSYPSKVAVIIIDGNLRSPSSYS